MRILIMFDLPVQTAKQRKDYRLFRKFLIKSGFMMLQESIYCKLAMNAAAGNQIIDNVKKNKPECGFVLGLKITEKQFSRMECIVGKITTDVLDSTDRVVIL